jgi:small ubiquitin-related modifier
MSDTEDAKPEESANEPITIRVKDQTGEETMFKIKKTTKMSKVFSAYAQRKGVEQASLRFLLDGERINEMDTPKMLELEDEDQIDCVLAQVGGSGDGDNDDTKNNDNGGGGNEGETKPASAGNEGGGSEPITIRVKDQNGEETMFKIKKSTRMKKVFATYAARKGVEATAMRFMLDGEVRFCLF